MISSESNPSTTITETLQALGRSQVDRRSVGRRLHEIADAVSGRLGQLLDTAADLLAGGAAQDIPPGTVDAIVSVALQGVFDSLNGHPIDDDAIDAHRCALEALKAIPGIDGGPVPGIDEMLIIERTSSAISALLAAVDALGRAVEAVPSPDLPGIDVLLAALDRAIDGDASAQDEQRPEARPAEKADAKGEPALPAKAEPAAAREVLPPAQAEESDAKKSKLEGTLRVDVGKVDQLLDLVGELIIASTAVRHIPHASNDSEALGRASAQLDRVVRSLQDVAMSLRMVPVGPAFRRMQRVVRDLSQKLGKTVDLQLSGEETEIDKTVAELVADPLVHLVRNALDHGIEPPEVRAAAGKPKTGTIRLSGANVGGEVWIRIEDDGRGLDRKKILARAVQRGLVSAESADRMSDADVYALIFEPGFSTAEAVTDVSGRGVGMDVVKRNIELVNGRIDIKSVPDQGALFTLRIPLTLAIIEGMLVRVGESSFTVPLLCIRESVVVKPAEVTVLSTWQEMVRIRGELLPVLRLHKLYNLAHEREQLHEGILVVIEDGGQPLCLFVDELIGQRQTVIKAIPGYLGTIRGIAGCTVLGDGRISLILDAGALVQRSINT